MEEELNLDNILDEDSIENLFTDDDTSSHEEDTDEQTKETDKENNNDTTEEIDVNELFTDTSESVGSEGKAKQGQEDTNSNDETGSSPKKPSFYSSIASALVEDGIFQTLDDKDIQEIKTAENFAEIIEKEIKSRFDERQKRIDDALSAGIEPTEVQKYERTLAYLDKINDDTISDESEKGEALRKQLIYNDFINRGYSKERANREVKKSFDGGTDIEDAKEALQSNKEFFQNSYDRLIREAQEEDKKYEAKVKKDAEDLKESLLKEDTVFGELQVDKVTRQKAFDAVSKPVYKDPDTGELYTALQKYEMENHNDFLKNVGLLYVLTDGFKNLDGLVKNKIRKEMKKGIRNLENTINNTSRTSDGNLQFMNNVGEDSESYIGKGWRLDV